ncbi:MAG: glycerophosphodiester phosphodiesterase [Pyrobaculum sp.]
MTTILDFASRRFVVGHRGYPAKELENTLPSIAAALESGVDVVEVDVQTTLDNVVVLNHDETLERTFGTSINVRKSTWSQLKKVEKGRYRLTTLREALEYVAGRAGVFIEVKNPVDTELVIETVRETGAEKWTAVISFFDEVVSKVPWYKGLVYSKPLGRVIDAKNLGCHFVLPHFRLATTKAVALAHRLGLRLVAWTINDVPTAVSMLERGVDGLATDRVEDIKKVVDKWR